MTQEQIALLELIKQSQFNIPVDIAWDTINMESLYNEASYQTVLSLVAPLIPEEYADASWRQAQLQQTAYFIRYCYAQNELKRILDNATIPFVILKGNAAAIYYKTPSKRTMGDIDFLVPQVLYEKAKMTLVNAGYIEEHNDKRHTVYKNNGMEFELHCRFSREIDIEDYLIAGIAAPDYNSIDIYSFPMLPRLANGLVLLDHMRYHLKKSMGIRQVIDWMMYVFNCIDDYYWENEFQIVAREKNLELLAITVTRMCQIYLGLPNTITWSNLADETMCNDLMEILLNSGNFGQITGRGIPIENTSINIKRMGLFPWLQHSGEITWEAYHKHHWLKPFCWLHQAFRYARKGFRSGRNYKQLKNDLNNSEKRYELLKKMKIY